MDPALWFQGGSNVTLENLTIAGSNPGGYTQAGAFAAGVRSDGVIGLRVSGVRVNNVWGDGLELTPLRASNDLSDIIINPSENVTVSGLTVEGAGRQGVTLASVNGATLTGVTLRQIGLNFFDVEADQGNEGAKNVTINGCATGGVGGLFFANAGMSNGSFYTGNITVENCTMNQKTAGDAVLIQAPTQLSNPRGPFTFLNDTLLCGNSVYVSCIQATDATVTVANSNVVVPAGTIHEPVFNATDSTGLTFSNDSISGYATPGSRDASSTVNITGGTWSPYVAPHQSSGPVQAGGGSTLGGSNTLGASASTTSTTSTSLAAVALGGNDKSGKGNGKGKAGMASSAGGPTTATVLSSDRDDPLGSPVTRSIIFLDLGAGAVAYGLLLVRRRRQLHVVPATHSVQDLLGRPRRHRSG